MLEMSCNDAVDGVHLGFGGCSSTLRRKLAGSTLPSIIARSIVGWSAVRDDPPESTPGPGGAIVEEVSGSDLKFKAGEIASTIGGSIVTEESVLAGVCTRCTGSISLAGSMPVESPGASALQ